MRVIILKVDVTATGSLAWGEHRHGDRNRERMMTLSPQQKEIARLMLVDGNQKSIAHEIGTTHKCVQAQISYMRKRLGVKHTLGLMLFLLMPEVLGATPKVDKDDLVLNRQSREVRRGRRRVKLGPKEYELMERLARAHGLAPLHPDRLVLAAYGGENQTKRRVPDITPMIAYLRRKLRRLDLDILNTSGVGYSLVER